MKRDRKEPTCIKCQMQQKKSRLRVDVDDEKGNVLNKTVEGIWKEKWHNSVTRLGEISSF